MEKCSHWAARQPQEEEVKLSAWLDKTMTEIKLSFRIPRTSSGPSQNRNLIVISMTAVSP